MTMTTADIAQSYLVATQPRPTATSFFRRLVSRIQSLASLSSLSDAHLRDIGLTRSDIDALRGLPLSTDTSTRLHIAATRQGGNW